MLIEDIKNIGYAIQKLQGEIMLIEVKSKDLKQFEIMLDVQIIKFHEDIREVIAQSDLKDLKRSIRREK